MVLAKCFLRWWDKFFSVTAKLLSRYISITSIQWTTFLFVFSTFLCLLPGLSLAVTAFNLLLPSIFFQSFCFLYFFGLREVFTTKYIDNFSKILALPWGKCWLPCVRLSFYYEDIDSVYILTFICPITSTIILFSKAHSMSCFHRQNFGYQ